jgi:hypothetical protein
MDLTSDTLTLEITEDPGVLSFKTSGSCGDVVVEIPAQSEIVSHFKSSGNVQERR